MFGAEDWVIKVTVGFVTDIGNDEGRDAAKDEGSEFDEEAGKDVDEADKGMVVTPDKDAKAAAALMGEEADAGAELATEDAKA